MFNDDPYIVARAADTMARAFIAPELLKKASKNNVISELGSYLISDICEFASNSGIKIPLFGGIINGFEDGDVTLQYNVPTIDDKTIFTIGYPGHEVPNFDYVYDFSRCTSQESVQVIMRGDVAICEVPFYQIPPNISVVLDKGFNKYYPSYFGLVNGYFRTGEPFGEGRGYPVIPEEFVSGFKDGEKYVVLYVPGKVPDITIPHIILPHWPIENGFGNESKKGQLIAIERSYFSAASEQLTYEEVIEQLKTSGVDQGVKFLNFYDFRIDGAKSGSRRELIGEKPTILGVPRERLAQPVEFYSKQVFQGYVAVHLNEATGCHLLSPVPCWNGDIEQIHFEKCPEVLNSNQIGELFKLLVESPENKRLLRQKVIFQHVQNLTPSGRSIRVYQMGFRVVQPGGFITCEWMPADVKPNCLNLYTTVNSMDELLTMGTPVPAMPGRKLIAAPKTDGIPNIR